MAPGRHTTGLVPHPVPGPALLRATRADLPDLVALAAANDQDPVAMREAFARDLDDPERPVLVAALGGVIVGYGRAARFEPPDGAPANVAPPGYYLSGLLVDAAHRRRRLGHALTVARLQWIFERARVAYYFADVDNHASVMLHARLGFVELTRDFTFPEANLEPGEGILFRLEQQ